MTVETSGLGEHEVDSVGKWGLGGAGATVRAFYAMIRSCLRASILLIHPTMTSSLPYKDQELYPGILKDKDNVSKEPETEMYSNFYVA